jgi:hypothetical protein
LIFPVYHETQTYKTSINYKIPLGKERKKKHYCKLQRAKIDEALQRVHISQDFKKHLMVLKAWKPFTFSSKTTEDIKSKPHKAVPQETLGMSLISTNQ